MPIWSKILSTQHCYFHPNIQAIDKCERCNKLICLRDKRTYTRTYSSSSMSTNNYNTYNMPVKYTFCPPCYYQAMESGFKSYKKISSIQKPLMLVFMIPFLLVPLGMIFMVIDSPFNSGSFGLFPLIFILFPLIFIFIAIGFIFLIIKGQSTASEYAKTEMNNISRDKAEFYSSHGLGNNFNVNELYCNQCGSRIQKTDLFCPNCGDTTKDELKMV